MPRTTGTGKGSESKTRGRPRKHRAVEAGSKPTGIEVAEAIAQSADSAAEGLIASESADSVLSEEARAEASEFPGVLNPVAAEQAESVAPPPRTYVSKKKAAQQAQEAATWLVVILEGAAMVGFGEDARMTDSEKKMIVDPLSRIMARMSPEVSETVQKFADPVLLVFGFATWGLRLYAIAQERGEEDDGRGGKPPAPKPVGPGGNGKVVEEVAPEVRVQFAGPSEAITSQVVGPGMNV